MIINSGSPLSPSISLTIAGVEVDYTMVVGLELDLCTNEHDVLTIQLNGIPSKAITDYINIPVRMRISSGGGRSHEFVGYILYVEPVYDASAPIVNETMFYTAKLVCFGASVGMKDTQSKVWGSTTIYKIAKELAAKYKLSLSVLRDEFVIPNAVQANESDWEFLSRLCDTYGYSMSMHSTHLSVWDPYQAIGRRASYEVLLPQNEYSGPTPGGIIYFKGTFGYLTPDGESYKYAMNTLVDDGSVVKVTDQSASTSESWSGYGETPLYTSTLDGLAVSYGEAEKLIKAEKRKNFPFNAEVHIYSGAGIVPGGVVSVEGYRSNFEGLWYVKSVRHIIGGTTYYTVLHIARDYNTTGEFLIPPVSLAATPPDSAYVDATWVAEKQMVDIYV